MTAPPPSSLSRQPQPFDPSVFARSVIALPLDEEIERELELTETVGALHKQLRETRNAAIFLNPAFPGGLKGALKAVRTLLAEAKKKFDTTAEQSIDDPNPSISEAVALARLDGRIIRQLLGKDAGRNWPPAIDRIWPTRFDVIIDINLDFKPLTIAAGGSKSDRLIDQPTDSRISAEQKIRAYIEKAKQAVGVDDPDQGVDDNKTKVSNQYVFGRLEGKVIRELVKIDQLEAKRMLEEALAAARKTARQSVTGEGLTAEQAIEAALPKITEFRFRTIHHIWPDFEVRSCVVQSIRTVKVDAARNSFTASGKNVTWAVMDTGIDASHPHFKLHKNIDELSPYHADFTGAAGPPRPLVGRVRSRHARGRDHRGRAERR